MYNLQHYIVLRINYYASFMRFYCNAHNDTQERYYSIVLSINIYITYTYEYTHSMLCYNFFVFLIVTSVTYMLTQERYGGLCINVYVPWGGYL